MKKSFFVRLLIVMISVFVLSTVSAVTVLAEDTQTFDAKSLFKNGNVELTDSGMMLKDFTSAKNYSYKMSLDELDFKFAVAYDTQYFLAESSIGNEAILTLKFTGSETNTVCYTFEGGKYYAQVNYGENKEVDNDFRLTANGGKLFDGSVELGAYNKNTVDAVSLAVTTGEHFDVTVNSINGVTFNSSMGYNSSTPNVAFGELFDKQKVLGGVEFDAEYEAYDLLGSVTSTIEYKYGNGEFAEGKTKGLFFTEYGPCQVRVKVTKNGQDSYSAVKSFEVVNTTDDGSVYYSITKEQYDEYAEQVNNALHKDNGELLRVDDSFKVPTLEGMLKSDNFGYSSLRRTVNYACTGKTSYSTTTSSSFTLTTASVYEFYVTATDELGATLSVDSEKHERKTVDGIYGWYDGDELVCPIWRFTLSEMRNPEITIDRNNAPVDAYLDTQYDGSKLFTVVAGSSADYTYSLYYMTKEDYDAYYKKNGKYLTRGSKGYENDAEYTQKVKELFGKELTLLEKKSGVSTDYISSSGKFTPAKESGYYYVVLKVNDDTNIPTEAVSWAVKAAGKTKSADYEKEYFKNNWVSFLFLGIAVLSFIGILILLFVKPKDSAKKTEEAKDAE